MIPPFVAETIPLTRNRGLLLTAISRPKKEKVAASEHVPAGSPSGRRNSGFSAALLRGKVIEMEISSWIMLLAIWFVTMAIWFELRERR